MMAAAAPAPHGGAEPVLLAAPGLSLDDLEVLARDPSGALMDRPALDGVDGPAAMVVGRRAGCPGCGQESLATRKALAAEYPGLTVIGIDRDDLPMPGPSADLPRAQRRIKDYRRCLAALQAGPPGLLAQADRALDQDEGLWTSSSAFFVSLAAAPYLEILSRKDRRQDADCSSLTLLWGEPKDGAPQPPQGGFIQDPTGRRRPRFPDKPMYRTDSPDG